MNNKFYGIGVGVGDPEEITLKAINILKKRLKKYLWNFPC